MKYSREQFIHIMLEADDDTVAEFTGLTDHDFLYSAEAQGVLGDVIGSAYDEKSPDEIARYEAMLI